MTLLCSCTGQQTERMERSPDNQEQIRLVRYSNAGGMLGWTETLVIRPDSVLYNTLMAAKDNRRTAFAERNTGQQWDELTRSLDLKAIKKVISGMSQQPVDGTDQTYTVVTSRGSYQFTNPDFSVHPDTALEKWVSLIQRLAGAYYQKSL